jgi:hypothetical protein
VPSPAVTSISSAPFEPPLTHTQTCKH